MSQSSLTILKFGGSVLTTPSSLDGIVQHIYRHVRDGEKVIAVVSAYAGETDRLLALSHEQVNDPDPGCVAAVAETGELYSASHLGLSLDRAGIAVHVLHAGAIGLQAEGPLLDATPTGLDAAAVDAALQTASVLVVPGFVGRTAVGRTCLLGRGGSDLTAIFLAAELKAGQCVLVKDVDGLFDRDPALDPDNAVRFDAVTCDQALLLDEAIIQHKAIRYASSHKLKFEVAGLLRGPGTVVGAQATTISKAAADCAPLRVALLGLGTVGEGVRQAIDGLEHVARVVSISTLCNEGIDPSLLMHLGDVHPRDYDVLIESTGSQDISPLLQAGLKAGRTVITANTALLASRVSSLHALAQRHGGRLFGSGSIGGSLPLLEVAAVADGQVERVEALLNGSTNVVIDRIGQGCSVDEAIVQAVHEGLCASDPWRDLAGEDAADKLVVLHHTIAPALSLQVHVPTQAEAQAALESVNKDPGEVRQVARWTRDGDHAVASVTFESLSQTHPLAASRCGEHIAVLSLAHGDSIVLRGRASRRWPTILAVMGDLLQVALETRGAVALPT